MNRVDLIGGYYKSHAPAFSRQDCVNFIPEFAQVSQTLTQSMLRGAPGFSLFANVSDDEIGKAGPIRGDDNVEGRFFFVSGNLFCELLANQTISVIGYIPGVSRVSITHNQIENGHEILITNGSSSGYVYSTATGVFSPVSDDAFVGAISSDYIDSYLVLTEPFGRFWYISDLANAKSYNFLDRFQAEASPDKIVRTIVARNEVITLNETTVQFFYNAGTVSNTFQDKGAVIDVGCAGTWTVANDAGVVAWLGNDGQFYALEGYAAIPISTETEVEAIKGLNWSQAFAFTFKDRGHLIAYWTFPDGPTLGYDFTTKLWHRRQSFGLKRWRLNTLTYWRGKWIGGDCATGKLYVLDWDVFEEDGKDLIAERITGPLHGDRNRFIVSYAELVMTVGTIPLGQKHEVMLTYSDDTGLNFKNWKIRSLGGRGQYQKRVRFDQLGQTLGRVWKIRVATRGKRDVIEAVLELEPTTP